MITEEALVKRIDLPRNSSQIAQAPDRIFIISLLIGCDEPDLDSSIQIAQELENAGVDMLNISTGMTTFIDVRL
jgi:tryptophan synthase alpha subunit